MTTHTLDTTGLRCPMPVLKAKRALRDLTSGEHLEVTVSDRAAITDFPAFCDLTGHRLVDSYERDSHYTFIIEKK